LHRRAGLKQRLDRLRFPPVGCQVQRPIARVRRRLEGCCSTEEGGERGRLIPLGRHVERRLVLVDGDCRPVGAGGQQRRDNGRRLL